MNIVKNILLVLLLSLVVGCTREVLSDCAPAKNVELTFSFTMNASGEDLFTKEVNNLDLFIFNSDGVLIRKESSVGPFESNYVWGIDLPAGIYTFVAWGGLGKSYEVGQDGGDGGLLAMELNKTTLEQARLIIEGEKTVVDTQLSPLFHGIVSNIKVLDNIKTVSNISLIKNTNTVSTKIIGLVPSAKSGNNAELFYTGTNSRFDFHNNIALHAVESRYEPYTTLGEDSQLITETILTRLVIAKPLILNIANNGMVIHRENLPKLLLDIVGNGIDSQQDLDRNDVYDITIDLNKIPYQVTITVNGWKIIRVIGSID